MAKYLSAAAFALILLVSGAPKAEALLYREIYPGQQHPWDIRELRHRDHVSGVPFISDADYYYSPFRSRTHALHSVHRPHYYTRYDYRDLRTGQFRINHDDKYPYIYENYNYPVRQTRDSRIERYPSRQCQNFSYERPNYRVPPFEHRCGR